MNEPVITNPNALTQARTISREVQEDADPVEAGRSQIRVRNVVRMVDPDKQVDDVVSTITHSISEVDAKLLHVHEKGRGRNRVRLYETKHYRSLAAYMQDPTVRKRVLDRYDGGALRELNERIKDHVKSDKQLREARHAGAAVIDGLLAQKQLPKNFKESEFYMGMYADEVAGTGRSVFPLQDTVLPSTNSPHAKQQLWVDYLDMHRKSWEAATRNPIGKRICDIIPQFVLGRGLVGDIKSPSHQEAWDDFWQTQKMRARMRLWLKELLIYGEIFLRYFRKGAGKGLEVRSLDPSSIWDIVTSPEDFEDVLYYHQQYTIQDVSPVPGRYVYPARLIIRQIPATEIDHYKINHVSSEKRGRSQLYAILGYLLRFKEFANDRVLLNKMRAMFALDVAVDGGSEDVAAAEAQFATPPGPGAVLIHNKAVEVEFKNANNNANEAKTDAEMILKIIAIGAGVSEQFLGVSGASTRAGALIQTEPDVKNFETYQEILQDILDAAWRRVQVAYSLPKTTERMEWTFPGLAQEDRSAKLKDIAFAESMGYFSKERSATMSAKEFQVTEYDYDAEQKKIEEELGKNPVISAPLQQVSKVAPDQPLVDEPGLGQDLTPKPKGAASKLGGDTKGVTQTSGQMGFSAKNLSGRGLANTPASLNRGSFTRGGERKSIQGQRSTSEAEIRASAGPPRRNVWNDAARAKALATRRANALKRHEQQTPPKSAPEVETPVVEVEDPINDPTTLKKPKR